VNSGHQSITVSNHRGHDRDWAPGEFSAYESENEAQRSGISFNDVLFILFRHKWKILVCAAIGILAAAATYFFTPSLYESQAKLLVRYVVERNAIDGMDSQGKNLGSPDYSAIAIHSEVEILTSSDLAMQVASKVGDDRLLPNSAKKATDADAALAIQKNLEVSGVKESNIISVSYKNEDPRLASGVLQELITRYFDKHLEVHRSLGAFDFVTREADHLRAELNQTEEELKRLKAEGGIISLAEDTASLATELAKVREDLAAFDGELAGQKARVAEIEKLMIGRDSPRAEATVPPEIIGEYQALIAKVAKLRDAETELLSKYTAQNRFVTVKQAQIEDAEQQRKSLENKYPGLLGTVAAVGAAQIGRPDMISEKARLIELQTRSDSLRARYKSLQERARMVAQEGPKIAQLERKKEAQETNYKYYGTSLEKARIDETLDPSRMPNISIVQAPSPPYRAKRDLNKVVFGLAGGGVAAGLAFAFLIELVVDRTVKRPLELETRLRIPLLLSIPDFGPEHGRLRLHDANPKSETANEATKEEGNTGELLRPFCEAIRERLGFYFEMNRMTHKPKLVAVTGLSKNAGASTLAAGLAAALSETSEGKVLLFDKPVASKRFYNLMQEFKASDLDYVVFDMPSVGDTSATLPMAVFMDKVLLVVEAEKSNRDAVKRAYTQLSARVDVSVIFNKSRTYGPKWLEAEI
jgi:polysaccharide biosynthesis transport protein